MSPHYGEGEDIIFGADPVGVGVASSALYLINVWMDFDQIYISLS